MREVEDEFAELLREPDDAGSAEFDEEWPELSALDLDVSISDFMPGLGSPDFDPEDA